MSARTWRTWAPAAAQVAGFLALLGIFWSWMGDAAQAHLSRLSWPSVAVAGLLYALGHTLNGLTWWGPLRAMGLSVRVGQMIHLDLVSAFWSSVLPSGVAGEVIKGVRLAHLPALQSEGEAGKNVTKALVLARLIGGGAAGAVGLLLLPWGAVVGAPRVAVAVALGGLAGAGGVGVAIGRVWLPGRRPAWRGLGVGALGACGTHLCFAGVYAACFHAVGAPIAVADAAWLSPMTSLAELAPVTIGGFGVRELALTALGAVLVPPPQAAAASLLLSAGALLTAAVGASLELLQRAARGQ